MVSLANQEARKSSLYLKLETDSPINQALVSHILTVDGTLPCPNLVDFFQHLSKAENQAFLLSAKPAPLLAAVGAARKSSKPAILRGWSQLAAQLSCIPSIWVLLGHVSCSIQGCSTAYKMARNATLPARVHTCSACLHS